ncbi:hypothetical protein [Mycobacteroides abscessus]|uniref:hypothetical protein n=1 Tax=Mycobacteroides abscessus TaxID=36809 RepID=UPI0012FF4A8A|nr:hypothetical protein [Mycobacteroides abscessus]
MTTAMWALVSQLLALLAIPHAAALGLAKLVGISARPGPTAASKTMDAAAYATLAVISAVVVRAYAAAERKAAAAGAVKPEAVAEGAQGGGVPLRDALGMYLAIYGLVLAALGALVYILGRVLRAESLYRVVGWLAGLYGAVLVIWVALLQLLKGSVAGLESAMASSMGALLLGPPAVVVAGVFVLWIQDRWRRGKVAAKEVAR